MIHDKLDNLSIPSVPKNTVKLQLIDNATGKVEHEEDITNSVGGVLTQIANHYYKYFANDPSGSSNFIGGHGQIGASGIYLWLYDTDFGINNSNGYLNIFKFRGIGEALDTTRNVQFYVTSVIDSTHLGTAPLYTTRQMQVGDTLVQTAARDVTAGIPFSITSVTDGTHLVVNNTTGMTAGDTISQYPTYSLGNITYGVSTTITTVTDGTHLVVGSTSGFNSVSTTITQIVSDSEVAVVSTTNWLASDEGDHVTAYNYQNAQAITSDARTGVYLPNFPGAGFQRDRSYQLVYEWGTSQGNGTVAAISFNEGYIPTVVNGDGTHLLVARVPEMANVLNYFQYMGSKTVSGRYQLYFVSQSGGLGTTLNNLAVNNYDDYSLVQQKSLSRGGTTFVFGSNSMKDMVYTSADGYIYGCSGYTSGNPNSLSMQRVLDVLTATDSTSSLTFTIVSVVDSTHMTVNSTTGMNPGDTIVQGSATTTITSVTNATQIVVGNTAGFNSMTFGVAATDTTHSISFTVCYIASGTQMYISNSAGMSAGDTITQGAATTTISSITSANLINVASTSGFSDGTFHVYYTTNFPGNFEQFNGATLRSMFSDNNYIYALVADNEGQSVALLTMNPLTFANDSSSNIPFSVTTVTDGTHLVVDHTLGMRNGDTIVQNGNSTTITTVTDSTHLVVGSTTNWVTTYAVATQLPATISTSITTDTPLINIDPVTGKLIFGNMNTGSSSGYVYEWPSISTLGNQQVPISYMYQNWAPSGQLSDATFIMYQDGSDRLVAICEQPSGCFFEMSRGNYLTYAPLSSPITKTNTQSLRVQYTLNF